MEESSGPSLELHYLPAAAMGRELLGLLTGSHSQVVRGTEKFLPGFVTFVWFAPTI